MNTALYMIVMAGVTYLIRMLPFAFFTKKIRSVFLRSVLYYIPYAVLAAMTIPAVFYSTGNFVTAAVGTSVALALAYFRLPLIVVALSASGAAFLVGLFV